VSKFFKTYVFDLDNTLCKTVKNLNGFWEYEQSIPFEKRIEYVNKLFLEGNYIIIDTARGSGSGKDFYEFTKNQLSKWGLRYHELRSGVKFASDYYIDDRAVNSEDFFDV
jgi:CMP-N,N'-diacetyllegionaminic acid synthase